MLATWVNTLYRRPWRAVVSKCVWYLVVFYVLRTPVFIWNRIARYPFLVILGNFWRLIFRSWAPNFGVKHDTQVKNTAKYAKFSWRERGYFIRDIISPSCGNKTQWLKNKQALNLPIHRPLFMNMFFNISLPWGSLHGFNLRRLRQHLTKYKRVEIIALTILRTQIKF